MLERVGARRGAPAGHRRGPAVAGPGRRPAGRPTASRRSRTWPRWSGRVRNDSPPWRRPGRSTSGDGRRRRAVHDRGETRTGRPPGRRPDRQRLQVCRRRRAGGRQRRRHRGTASTLRVDDSGPGIPEDQRDAVFDRFHRASDAAGTGLGLAIADSAVHSTQGTWEIGVSDLGGARMEVSWRRAALRRGRAGIPRRRSYANLILTREFFISASGSVRTVPWSEETGATDE